MILFAILLSSGLDMTLPEFEPTTDISGNYIYTEFVEEENEVVVEESDCLPQGLTTEGSEDSSFDYVVLETSSGGGDEPTPDDPSGNDPSGGGSVIPYDDTKLLEKIDHIDVLLRSILFANIWIFILPIAMKIRDHIFNLKHE